MVTPVFLDPALRVTPRIELVLLSPVSAEYVISSAKFKTVSPFESFVTVKFV